MAWTTQEYNKKPNKFSKTNIRFRRIIHYTKQVPKAAENKSAKHTNKATSK